MHMRWVQWEGPRPLPVGPRSHKCDNKQPKKLILLLKFAVTLYLGSKKVGCMINKWQFCATKLARKATYASGAFFGKYMKILLVKTNYAKNYASTIYSKSAGAGRKRAIAPWSPDRARVSFIFATTLLFEGLAQAKIIGNVPCFSHV